MQGGTAADIAIVVVGYVCYVAYNLYYFVLRGTIQFGRRDYTNLWNTSVKTRSLWVDIMSADPKEGINSVQTLRNMGLAVSLLAAAQSTLAAQMMTTLTDPARLEQFRIYSSHDPISGGAKVAAPEVKVGIGLGLLFLSLMLYAQCARGSIHAGFVMRVIPTHPHLDLNLRDDAILLVQRISLYFSIGLRIFFCFIPTFFWCLGTTAYLCTMAVVILALAWLDQLPRRHPTSLARTCTNFIDTANSLSREGSLRRHSGRDSAAVPPEPRGGQEQQRKGMELGILTV